MASSTNLQEGVCRPCWEKSTKGMLKKNSPQSIQVTYGRTLMLKVKRLLIGGVISQAYSTIKVANNSGCRIPIPVFKNPSCLQATLAALVDQYSSQMVPQVSL